MSVSMYQRELSSSQSLWALPESRAIEVRGADVPTWAPRVIDRLKELDALPTVDIAGSKPLNFDDVLAALQFLARNMREDTVSPWVGRLPSGGVQLAWRCGDVELEAVFDVASDESEVILAVGENEWESPIRGADSLFATVVDRLTNEHVEYAAGA